MPSVGSYPSYASLCAELPAAFVPVGYTATTADQGVVESNGVSWWPVGSGGGGNTPVFSDVATAPSQASFATINAASVPGYISGTTNRIKIPAASGGTTINTIDMSGATDGFTFVLDNTSGTDPVALPNNSGSGTGSVFINPNAGQENIAPHGATLVLYVAGVGLKLI